MKQYLDLLKNILDNGVEKESGRENMPNTIGISGAEIRMNMENGFPLLTTKEMYWKGIIHELLWIMRGDTNIKYLVDNNVNIWNGDAYRWYQKHLCVNEGIEQNALMHDNGDRTYSMFQIDEFINEIKKGSKAYQSTFHGYRLGDLGKVYGYQWRNQNGVDQLAEIIKTLQTNPFSRYHILDAWNKSDFNDMALPPCHLLYQFIVRPFTPTDKVNWLNMNYLMYDQKPWTLELVKRSENNGDLELQYKMPKFFLDLSMYQRSCDTFLGVPFNIASMSAFLIIMAKVCGMAPGEARWIGGDVHLYIPHRFAAKEQTERTPFQLPKLNIKRKLNSLEDILKLTIDDFEVLGYHFHPKMKQELFTGYKV